MSFVSLYGTDGCGKSTIAHEIANSLPSSSRAQVISGSAYKEWLTPELAGEFMQNDHVFGDTVASDEDKLRLYEDVAIVTYGLAYRLSEEGNTVIIDSDPFFKRIIWGTLGKTALQATEYTERFNDRLSRFLHDKVAPGALVGINVSPESATTEEQLLLRLKARGAGSEHDPKNISEATVLNAHVRYIWSELVKAKDNQSFSPSLNKRMLQTETATYENPHCSPEKVEAQARKAARFMIDTLLLEK